jgi:hypothetical protein
MCSVCVVVTPLYHHRGMTRATYRRMRWLLAIALCSCAPSPASVVDHPAVLPSPPGEQAVALPGGGNALWWDAASSTLYLTDSNASSLVAWTEAAGLHAVATLPADAAERCWWQTSVSGRTVGCSRWPTARRRR